MAETSDTSDRNRWMTAEWAPLAGTDRTTPARIPADDMATVDEFWPGRGTLRELTYERFDDFLLLRPRHLPTEETVETASRELGEGAAPVIRVWQAIWSGVGDVAELAREIGYEGMTDPFSKLRAKLSEESAALVREGRRALSAATLVAVARLADQSPVRSVAQHVLEDATVLVELARSMVPVALALTTNGNKVVYLRLDRTEGRTRLVRLTDKTSAVVAGRHAWQKGALNAEWPSPAFRKASGRIVTPRTTFGNVAVTLLAMARAGHAKAFLKHVVMKRGTWVVDLEGVVDLHSAFRRLSEAMGLAISDLFLSGREATVTVQEHLPFTHEHRFFVVGHRVVASTPSARHLGLADASGRLLDPRTARLLAPATRAGAYDRGESEVVTDRRMVAAMAWLVRDMARSFAREGRYHGHYVVDAGTTDKEPVVVEVNSFASSGLYAVDYTRVARALGRWYGDAARRPKSGFKEESGDATAALVANGPSSGPLTRLLTLVGKGPRRTQSDEDHDVGDDPKEIMTASALRTMLAWQVRVAVDGR